MKLAAFFLACLLCPVCVCAQISATAPAACLVNEKTLVRVNSDAQLPASSFFRVEINCPQKPDGAKITTLPGWPESEISFSTPGRYECMVEAGIVTKNSCAGVAYKSLGQAGFGIEVKEPD